MDDHTPNEADAPAAGDAGFPRCDGAACTGCGTWHRRYGPRGGAHRAKDVGSQIACHATAKASAGCMCPPKSV
jgi:hypothetical protein